MKALLCLFLWVVGMVPAWAADAPATLRIATGELPPYATASRPDQGMALAIVRKAFEAEGYRVSFHFMPWSRALSETRSGRWDASAHWGVTPERRRDFLLSDNLYTEQWHLLYRRGSNFDWKTVQDLRPYRLGLVRDYTYTPDIWAAAREGQQAHEVLYSDLAGLRMLMASRIDVLPLDRQVACHLLHTQMPAAAGEAIALHPRLITDRFTTHVLFPPQLPNSVALRDAFNRGLHKLRTSGAYAQLARGLTECPEHWGRE